MTPLVSESPLTWIGLLLLGEYDPSTQSWRDGVLTRHLRGTATAAAAAQALLEAAGQTDKPNKGLLNPPSVLRRWLVLDGALGPDWTESLGSLLKGDQRKLSLGQGEQLPLPDSCSVLFETTDLSTASPALVSRCGILHCAEDLVYWKSLTESWLGSAKSHWEVTSTSGTNIRRSYEPWLGKNNGWSINRDRLQMLSALIEDTFGPTLDFLSSHCQPVLTADLPAAALARQRTAPGIQEVSSFLRILSALCDKFLVQEDEGPAPSADDDAQPNEGRKTPSPVANRPVTGLGSSGELPCQANPTTLLLSIFTFSYTWSFGGHLHHRYWEAFDQFARQTLGRASFDIHLPPEGSVYDYCVDPQHGVLMPWGDRGQDKPKTLPSGYTVIPEVERYFSLVDLLVSSNYPVLLAGPPGVGKTSLMQNMVHPKHYFLKTSLSPGLSCQSFEDAIISKLRPRSVAMGNVAPGNRQQKTGSSHLFFLDDLNCAYADQRTGALPCVDVLRQLMSQGGVYHRRRLFFRSLEPANFVVACAPPGSPGVGSGRACHALPARLARRFCVLSLGPPGPGALAGLHRPNLQGWLEEFPAYSLAHHYEMAQALLGATQDLHAAVKTRLVPTPLSPHYTFSLHDLHRLVQGLYLLSPHNRARPRHGNRRGGGGRPQAAAGRSRRVMVKGAAGQAASTVPPMMRTVVRLWCHEATRTYCDRVASPEDEAWFCKELEHIVERRFCTGEEKPRTLTPVNNMDADQAAPPLWDSPRSTPPLFLSPSPGLGSLPPTPFSLTSSLGSDEGGDEIALLGREITGISSTARDSSGLTEEEMEDGGDTESERDLASATPSLPSSAGSTITEQSTAEETSKPTTGGDADGGDNGKGSGMTPPSAPIITTRQPTPTQPTPQPPTQPTPTQPTPQPPTQPTPQPPATQRPQTKTLTPALVREGQPRRGKGEGSGEVRLGTKGRSRGVTFQIGPASEAQADRYKGPLLSMDQVRQPGENLCDIIFSKYIVSGIRESERGYVECSEGQLFEGLQRCLMQYNNTTSHRMELVFFKEAMRHVAKLTRVFATQGANALLIGLSYGMARSPLTRLAAFAARCRLFDGTVSQASGDDPAAGLRAKVKQASQVAGLMGKPAVLVVRGAYGARCLQDVCALMTEGSCPDLYSKEELDTIASQMLPGAKVTGHRNQRLEMALERFYRKVMANLHVVVCIDCEDCSLSSLHTWLSRFPALLNACCCVDIYRPWSHEALVNVAEQWLRVPTTDAYTGKTYRVPWSSVDPSGQLTAVSHAMAYVHRSSMAAVARAHSKPFKFFSPLTYLEFIDLFKNLASKIGKEEKASALRYERALDALNESFEAMEGYGQELERLQPLRQQAQGAADQRLQEVEECKAVYAEAKGMCNEDEGDIATMQEPLLEMKKQTQDELDKVNPVYEAAWHALKSLEVSALIEIRSFRAPPAPVIKVVNALCLMFREPYDGKALINRDNFFQELEFYDKTAIPDDIYHRLNVLFIQDPAFRPEVVASASRAAASLCRWVHAVYAYAAIHRNMRPKLLQVEEAEGKLHEAQGHLGEKRVKAQDVKGQLEEKVRQYKEAMRLVRSLDKGIESVEGKIARAESLMTSMATQHATWKAQRDRAHGHARTAPGDALLAAASVCYQGPLGQAGREGLLADWLDRCRTGRFPEAGEGARRTPTSLPGPESAEPSFARGGGGPPDHTSDAFASQSEGGTGLDGGFEESLSSALLLAPANSRLSEALSTDSEPELYPIGVREDFTPEAILSSPEELRSWLSDPNLPHDTLSIHSALFMRACCVGRQRQWPLLIDPDDQALTWVKLLHQRGLASFHEGMALEEGSDTQAALSVANVNELGDLEDSLSAETLTTKPTSRATSEDWDNGSDYPETPRMLTSVGGDSQYTLKNSFNYQSEADYDPSSARRRGNLDDDDEDSGGGAAFFLPEEDIDEGDVQRPVPNLWVIPADHPSLERRLAHAAALGDTAVVTHLERRAPGPALAELVRRNVKGADQRRILIGGRECPYGPTFALYLSTSVPLELTGSGFDPLPIEDTSVIDLSTSPQRLTDQLLQYVMSVERPEFQGQWRSIEGDIFNHEDTLRQAEEDILTKTLDLPHSLLDEPSMTEALDHYQDQTLRTAASLHESKALAGQLGQRRASYAPVARQGALLYAALGGLARATAATSSSSSSSDSSSPLHHHTRLAAFRAWFRAAVAGRRKGGRAGAEVGSAPARALELAEAVLRESLGRLALAAPGRHARLLAFLMAAGRLRADGQASEAEWLQFVAGPTGPTDTAAIHETPSESSGPDWMTPSMWASCYQLETDFKAFHGLRHSLVQHSQQWQEYFQHDPVLLAPTPGARLAGLTFMQKALLWRVLRPDKLASICQDLTIYTLGSHTARLGDYSVEEVLAQTDQYTPVVFILPAGYNQDGSITSGWEGHTDSHPASRLRRHCRQQRPEPLLHAVSLGTEGQAARAALALQQCSQAGHWLLLDNFDLVGAEGPEILRFVQKMVTAKLWSTTSADCRPATRQSVQSGTGSSMGDGEDDGGEAGRVRGPESCGRPDVHANFRLFLVTRADGQSSVPGLILQHGIKVTCEASANLRESLRLSFNEGMEAMEASKFLVTPDTTKTTREMVFGISLLHTVLSQRRRFNRIGFSKDYHWSESDLLASLEMLRNRSQPTTLARGHPLSNLRELIGGVIYGGRVDVEEDRQTVQSLVDSLVLSWQDVQLTPSSMGVASLLSSLLLPSHAQGRHGRSSSGSHARRLQRVFDGMKEEVLPAQLGLVADAPVVMETRESRFFASALQKVERGCAVSGAAASWRSVTSLLVHLERELQDLPSPDGPQSADSLSYLAAFLAAEVADWRRSLGALRSEVGLLLGSALGAVSLGPSAEESLAVLGRNGVPGGWLAAMDGAATVDSSATTVADWLGRLKRRAALLERCVRDGERAVAFDLAAFGRPKMFLRCLLQEHARKEYIEVHRLSMSTQVMDFKEPPETRPESGAYVTGLRLNHASWDPKQSLLALPDTPDPSVSEPDAPCPLPLVWFKPVVASLVADGNGIYGNVDGNSRLPARDTYRCPLYAQGSKVTGLAEENLLGHVDLPSMIEGAVWSQKRIFITP